MKHNFIRYSIYGMIVLLIGVGALAASRANAQLSRENTIEVLSYSFGISPGQTARISVVNFGDRATTANNPVTANIQLLDTEGKVIVQSGEIEVAPGHTNVFNPSFQGGVYIQVRARVFVKFVTEKPFDINRDRPPFAATVEVVDSSTGKTTMISTEWVFVAT
jgi:hypothetical protein